MYAVTLNLVQFRERRFKVYRPCETNTRIPPSHYCDIIVPSITTDSCVSLSILALIIHSFIRLIYFWKRRKSRERGKEKDIDWRRIALPIPLSLLLYYYLSSPSITARLRFAIWRSSKIKEEGMKKGWWVCPRKCRLRVNRLVKERREWMPLCMPWWSSINTSFLQAL